MAKLLASPGPHAAHLATSLREIDPALPARIAELHRLDAARAERALACALTFACQAQHIANINLGRAAVLAMPRDWTIANVVHVARLTLDLEDPWEMRRFLELLSELDFDLLRRFSQEPLGSAHEEVREAAEDALNAVEGGDPL